MDLSLSTVSLIAVLILAVGLVQEILKYFYHRDNIVKQQKMNLRIIGDMIRSSDIDPYQFNMSLSRQQSE